MDVLSDLLSAIRNGHPHASRTETQGPWGIRFPQSDTAGCHVVLQGACWLIPAHGVPIALGVGDVVFIPPLNSYVLTDRPGSPVIDFRPASDDDSALGQVRIAGSGATTVLLCAAYHFERARSHPLLDELPEVIHLPARFGHDMSLRSAVELLGNELAVARAGTIAIIPALIDMLLLFILRAWLDEHATQTTTGWAVALNDSALMPALRGIHRHPERSWTVAELAKLAGLSRATFAKRFTAIVNQSPLAYLTWWRMTIAARMLRDSDTPLRMVAARVGYASEFAFAKAFKREYNVAPGRYRQENSSMMAEKDLLKLAS